MASAASFSDTIASGISKSAKFVNVTENDSFYLVIDSLNRLTRIKKADGTKKSILLPRGGDFEFYRKAEMSDDQKTLFTFAGSHTLYIDIGTLKIISSLSKDINEVPPGCSKNIYKNWTLRTNNYDDIMIQNILDDQDTSFINGGELLAAVESLSIYVPRSRRGEVFEAYLIPKTKEIWSIVDDFLVALNADSKNGTFAMSLSPIDRKRRLSGYSADATQFAIETNENEFSVIDLKTKKIIKRLNLGLTDIASLNFINHGNQLALLGRDGRLLVYNTKTYELAFDSKNSGLYIESVLGGNNSSYNFLLFSAIKQNNEIFVAYDFNTNKAFSMTSRDLNGFDISLLDGFKMAGRSSKAPFFYVLELR